MTVSAAASGSNPSRAIAACSVPTARCPVRRSRRAAKARIAARPASVGGLFHTFSCNAKRAKSRLTFGCIWQQRCLEVAPRLHHVGVVDETRRTYRHHGRQRDAPRRTTFRHATLRVAPHRYATLEPLGKPGGSRAFIADGPPQAPVAPRRSCNCCQTTGLNRRAVGAYSRDVRIPTRFRGAKR
jgi:hypothetical protein